MATTKSLLFKMNLWDSQKKKEKKKIREMNAIAILCYMIVPFCRNLTTVFDDWITRLKSSKKGYINVLPSYML